MKYIAKFEVSKITGLSPKSILSMAARNINHFPKVAEKRKSERGAPTNFWLKAEIEEWFKNHGQAYRVNTAGMITTSEVAEILGKTPATISSYKKYEGFNFPQSTESIKGRRTSYYNKQEILDWKVWWESLKEKPKQRRGEQINVKAREVALSGYELANSLMSAKL